MASFNKVILIGNLTADPELKQTASGISACTFSIAVNRRYKDQNGNTECDFINIVAWRERAEFVTRYFTKGKPILVCGQIQTRNWTDSNGQKRYATEVIADEVSFVAPAENAAERKEAANPGAYIPDAYKTPSEPKFEEIPADEGLPF